MGLQQCVSIFKHAAASKEQNVDVVCKNEAWPYKRTLISTRKVESYSQQLFGDMQFSLLFIISPPQRSFG